jgi:hypothetical protein
MSDDPSAVLAAAQREEWLTVKEFAALVRMRESSVRDAIRKQRLSYRVERVTKGPKGTIRIVVPRHAA